MNYSISSNTKKFLGGLVAVGIILMGIGAVTTDIAAPEAAHVTFMSKLWSNVLANSVFFFGTALLALFFIAMQYAAEAGWATVLKRIFEGVSIWLPIGSIMVLAVVAWGVFGGQYHWAHYAHMDNTAFGEINFDHLLDKKSAFLNVPFVLGGITIFLLAYNYFHRKFLARTDQEDEQGGTEIYKKNITSSAIFLVFFGFTSVVLIWMVLMSIDAHWFSTLYGWYVFSGMWISFITVSYLIINHLRGLGHMQFVTNAHLHDMGKWMFAISFLWSYLWFCQFMLIWYSNIPEEVTYYMARINDYPVLFFGTFIINFAFPMVMLMDKDAKVNKTVVTIVGLLILFGHYMDTWLLITPGVMKQYGSFGMFELGMFIMFLGLFLFVVMTRISKKPLIVKNHPFLDESKHLGGH